MNKLIIAAAVSGLTLAGAGIGLVNADTSPTTTSSTATSTTTSTATSTTTSIPRYTVGEERLNAIAAVLNTTPSQLEDTLKTQTMQQVIQSAGLTPTTFHQKVKAQLQSNLKAKGYSQAQVDSALSRSGMHRMGMGRHMDHDKDDATSKQSS